MNKGKNPVRVAQIMGKMQGGGVEQVVMNLYRHIDRSQVQFDFLVDADSTLVPRQEIEELGGRVLEIPPYQRFVTYATELEALFRKERWVIVHSQLNSVSVFPLRAAKRAGVPIRIAHSQSTSGQGEFFKNALKAIFKTQANRYPTHRLACSQAAGEWLFGKGVNFDIVYGIVDLGLFAFDLDARKTTRSQLGIAESSLVVGHVGRLVTVKNHLFLIDAFYELLAKEPDAVLLLIGDGPLKSQIEQHASELGISDKVKLLGQRNDVAKLYQALDVFALPSLYEGLPLVGVEAQRAGLPCFFSDTVTEEIAVSDKVRFLPIENAKDWADAIVSADCGTSNRSLVGREHVFAKFDVKESAKWLGEMYLRLSHGINSEV